MSVTAVPIRPIARGSVLKLWIALALLMVASAAVAWIGTAPYQTITLPSGVRYRTIDAGHGPAMTSADVIALRYKLHVNSVESPVIQDSEESGQPFVTTTSEVFPGFAEALQRMRAGGTYLLWLPPGTHVAGPPPPGAPFSPQDTLVFELSVLQIAPGMAQQRQMQMMQQMMQGGAPGGAPADATHGGGPEGGPGAPPAETSPGRGR